MTPFPFMQFFVGSWMSDPKLSMCSAATRGIWMDALCAMHINGRVGELSGTPDQLARACRCLPAEMSSAIADLHTTGAADVTNRNGVVTLICRRMKHEHEERKACSERVKKHRNGGVTPPLPPPKRDGNGAVTDTRASEVEDRSKKPEPPNPQGGGGGGSLSEKEDFWRWACDLIGQPGIHKSRQQQDALYDAPVPSAEDRRLVERYHKLARQEPTKYPKPRQTVIGLISEFYAEVGKARQALNIPVAPTKKVTAMPDDWPAFVAAHYRQNQADLLSWKSPEDGRARQTDVFDAIWQEFKEWRKKK